jgi:hypothetical protein
MPNTDVVAFGDNASIHKSCSEEKQDYVEMLFNIPYRPDLMGVESVWHGAKAKYREEVARLLVTRQEIDNLKLVKKILGEVTDEECTRVAAIGWRNLMKAKPVEYDEAQE